LKDAEDLKKWLELPQADMSGDLDISPVLEMEERLGDAGIIRLETPDPLCVAAELFDMATYTIIAMTELELFRRALDKVAEGVMERARKITEALPGRLWRICGPEYASPPYLPPSLFKEYVTDYDKPIVEMIQKSGGYARIHSHGNLKDILDMICETGCMGLDPVEPPPQGDVELEYVRERYGEQLVLFGNLEASDLENLSTERFGEKIKRALDEGTKGCGRGFVLMPSACPYGRTLSSLSMKNYEKMVELVNDF
jgi:uroporphyrinogen-III decarboxylase